MLVRALSNKNLTYTYPVIINKTYAVMEEWGSSSDLPHLYKIIGEEGVVYIHSHLFEIVK